MEGWRIQRLPIKVGVAINGEVFLPIHEKEDRKEEGLFNDAACSSDSVTSTFRTINK
jgi:hypothetical protein